MFFREPSFQGKEVDVHVDGELLAGCTVMPMRIGRIFKSSGHKDDLVR